MIGPKKWPANRLLSLAVDWLRDREPDALIVPEFSIGAWGQGAVDVAAITFEKIIGVEIKGEGDSPSRLRMQGLQYGMVMQEMFLLPAPSLEKRCNGHRPPGWGRLQVDLEAMTLTEVAVIGGGVSQRNSILTMLDSVWAEELRTVCEVLGFQWWKGRKDQTVDFIAERAALRDVRPVFVHVMRTRDWRKFGKAYHGELCVDHPYKPPEPVRLVRP